MDDLLRATARAEERHFWFRGFRWFVQPLIRRALGGTTRARVLDCGCGTGANLALFTPFGTSYGFDQSAFGLQTGHDLGRQGLVRASAAAVPVASQAFDLVTSFDVLYTLDDHDERAGHRGDVSRRLRPGGYVLINDAAMPMLRGDHSVLSHERRRYTRDTLARLVTAAGFRIAQDHVAGTPSTRWCLCRCSPSRLFHRARGLSAEANATAEISIPAAPINTALSALLFVESVWLRAGANPFGSSLLCLARKPEDAGPR